LLAIFLILVAPRCLALHLPAALAPRTFTTIPIAASATTSGTYEQTTHRPAEPLTIPSPLRRRADSSSADCAQLAKDPTADPQAYAIACAHEFGTQVPPYTQTIGAEGSSSRTSRSSTRSRSPSRSSSTSSTRSSSSPHSKSSTSTTRHHPSPTHPSIITVTAITTPSTSAAPPVANNANTAPPAGDSNDSSTHTSAIGATVGVLAAFALIGGGAFYTRKKWLPKLGEFWTKQKSVLKPKLAALKLKLKLKRNSREHYSAEMFASDKRSFESGEGSPGGSVRDDGGGGIGVGGQDGGDGNVRGGGGYAEMSGGLGGGSAGRSEEEMALPGPGYGKNKRYYSVVNPDPRRREQTAPPSFEEGDEDEFKSERDLGSPTARRHDEFGGGDAMGPMSPRATSDRSRDSDRDEFAGERGYGDATPGANADEGYEDEDDNAFTQHSATLRDSGAYSRGPDDDHNAAGAEHDAASDDGEPYDDLGPDCDAALQYAAQPNSPFSHRSDRDTLPSQRPASNAFSQRTADRTSVASSQGEWDEDPIAPTFANFPSRRRTQFPGEYDVDVQSEGSERPISGETSAGSYRDDDPRSPGEYQQSPGGPVLNSTIPPPPNDITHYSTFGEHPFEQRED